MQEEVRDAVQRLGSALAKGVEAAVRILGRAVRTLLRTGTIVLMVVLGAAYAAYKHPPMQAVERGEVGLRANRLTGDLAQFREGPVWVVPGLHELRRYGLRDRVYRPAQVDPSGTGAFQSIEGLSLGVDLTIRYALDPASIASKAAQLPDDIDREVVEPAVQGVIYKTFTRYTVREIFSNKRASIQQEIEAELKPRLAADGILLRSVQMGKVDLPADYRAGMEKLLAEELETEKMRYTLALKDQQVKQSALEADAEKVRREKSAEAAGNEQVIAARAQAEAMKHVLPFKEKQIQQRRLEAEAEKLSRISQAEGNAAARRIEAAGEADSRKKLADAESYRLESMGKVTSAQMERDGQLLSKHPLLIQKTMADKLSDKVQVIIAPPSQGFIGAGLLGQAGASAASTHYAEGE